MRFRANYSLVMGAGKVTGQEVSGFSAFMAGPNLGIEIWDPLHIWRPWYPFKIQTVTSAMREETKQEREGGQLRRAGKVRWGVLV
jgi:hypothetical protein